MLTFPSAQFNILLFYYFMVSSDKCEKKGKVRVVGKLDSEI
jgi:hypothetical protein